MVAVPEEQGTADGLRAVAHKISAQTFVVMSGDLLTDVPVNALVAMHQLNNAMATIMLSQRKTPPAAETKPGKAPKVSAGPPLGIRRLLRPALEFLPALVSLFCMLGRESCPPPHLMPPALQAAAGQQQPRRILLMGWLWI